MVFDPHDLSLVILLVGAVIVAAILTRALLERTKVPPLLGFMFLGFLLNAVDRLTPWNVLTEGSLGVLEFLSAVGIIALLFRIGLESDLPGLVHQLPRAGVIWIGNILLSGIPGYVTARYLLGFELVPSLFVAVAFTATSVGVSMRVWQERNALNSDTGELLIDVAELDDISGVAFMAILFAIVPILHGESNGPLWGEMLGTAALFIMKLAAFTAVCIVFSRYIEKHLTNLFTRLGKRQEPMLLVAGTGIVIAALAGWLGFSLAIGALFAGLVFCRDPNAVKQDASFGAIYELFTPFFFIGIGLKIQPDAFGAAWLPALVLLLIAVFGKFIGTGLPALVEAAPAGALLIGISMVPRAEITMIIIERGRSLGDWAVPPNLFAAMVVISAATCLIAPLVLDYLLQRNKQSHR